MSLYHTLTEGTVQVGPVTVPWYDTEGGEPGQPPVVLLHGTTGPAEGNFWALFPMLAFTRRVITFDFTLPPEDVELTLGHYVAQAEAVIASRCPGQPVCLVGHSLGAVVAAALAGRSPGLVDSLVLLAGWLRTDRQQLLRNQVWQRMHEEGSAALPEFAVYTAYSHQYLIGRTPRDYQAMLAGAARRSTSPRVMELNRRIDILDDCLRITAPTLVVGCTHDQMVPVRHSRELFGAIADSRYLEVASGHAVVQERASEVFVIIDRFAAAPRAAAAGTFMSSTAGASISAPASLRGSTR
jgi:pimeloyl-ACP methyl ester carboxylesterase